MISGEPVGELSEAFSAPGATPTTWAEVDEALTSAEMFFLASVRRDGGPHVTPLPAIWDGGALHVAIAAHEQKAKNLRADARCVLTTGSPALRSGLDVVVEGAAERVTDEARLHELAALWKSKLDWQHEVVGDGFRDPGGRTGHVFAVVPTKVLAFAKGEAPAQTRFRP